MQEKLSSIMVVAYTPEDYEKIFAISEDRDEVDKDWAQWREAADEKKSEAAMQGIKYVEQYIDAEGLIKYCQQQGKPINARSRTDYSHFLLSEQPRQESLVPPDKSEE